MQASVEKIEPYVSPWQVLASLPPEAPILFFGGSGRYAILALAFDPLPHEMALRHPFYPDRQPGLPFHYGIMGFTSYDDFSLKAAATSRYFAVHKALVFDQKRGELFLTQRPGVSKAEVDLPLPAWPPKLAWRQAAESLQLRAYESDAVYLQKAGQVIEDIRAGRYYQLNLLRYFTCPKEPEPAWIINRLAAFGGPYAAWLRYGGDSVISFSPECFIRGEASGHLVARPVKGTRKRLSNDDQEDTQGAQALLASVKDRQELAIITDLLRNDLQRVSKPHSVIVSEPLALMTLAHLHHLYAEIQAAGRHDLSLGQFLSLVCPAGSITGAPKREVMSAITEFEGRGRGFFMGTAFYLDDKGGGFDSSVLIRTLTQRLGYPYEFAAGSGIILGSDPHEEMAEINVKCAVVGSI